MRLKSQLRKFDRHHQKPAIAARRAVFDCPEMEDSSRDYVQPQRMEKYLESRPKEMDQLIIYKNFEFQNRSKKLLRIHYKASLQFKLERKKNSSKMKPSFPKKKRSPLLRKLTHIQLYTPHTKRGQKYLSEMTSHSSKPLFLPTRKEP